MTEVILLEDYAPLRRLLTGALRTAGYNVTSFDDGVISGDSAVMAHADLLITDISMPIVGGFDAIMTLRKTLPNLRCIVISGKPELDCAHLNVDAFLRKPFEPDDLIKAVEQVLSNEPCPHAASPDPALHV